VEKLDPFCLDVSSGIETNGKKDKNKMEAFSKAVGKEEK
jgi:phosphoribosylanthranilate isomerase